MQINGYALNGQQWDELVRNATQAPLFGGRNLEDFLRARIESPVWQDNQSAQDHGQLLNGMLVQKAIDSAYDYARTKFMQDHPQFTQLKQAEILQKFQAATTYRASPTQDAALEKFNSETQPQVPQQ